MGTDPTVPNDKPSRRGARHGTPYRPRLRGAEREDMGRRLAAAYHRGATIRDLVPTFDVSYGLARTLLLEAGVELRTKRGTRDAAKTTSETPAP